MSGALFSRENQKAVYSLLMTIGETDQGLRRGNLTFMQRAISRRSRSILAPTQCTEEIGHAQEANQTLVGIAGNIIIIAPPKTETLDFSLVGFKKERSLLNLE